MIWMFQLIGQCFFSSNLLLICYLNLKCNVIASFGTKAFLLLLFYLVSSVYLKIILTTCAHILKNIDAYSYILYAPSGAFIV